MRLVGYLKSLSSCFALEGWDKTFEHQGDIYAVIVSNGYMPDVKVLCSAGMVPCLNLKSHIIRALDIYAEVIPLKTTVNYEKN